MHRSHRLAVAVSGLAVLGLPAVASAQPTCTFNAGTHVVEVRLDVPATPTRYSLTRPGAGIAVDDGLAVTPPVACPGATVFTTDLIRVKGTVQADTFDVNLAGGGFAPGFTPEAGGLDEIEIEVDLDGPASLDVFEVHGTNADDWITSGLFGGGRIDVTLDHDGDADVQLDSAIDRLRYFGLGGRDTLGVGGVFLGLVPWTGRSELVGGPGNDALEGGDGRDILRGDGGVDTFAAGLGNDRLFANDGNAELVDSGPGADTVKSDALDTVT